MDRAFPRARRIPASAAATSGPDRAVCLGRDDRMAGRPDSRQLQRGLAVLRGRASPAPPGRAGIARPPPFLRSVDRMISVTARRSPPVLRKCRCNLRRSDRRSPVRAGGRRRISRPNLSDVLCAIAVLPIRAQVAFVASEPRIVLNDRTSGAEEGFGLTGRVLPFSAPGVISAGLSASCHLGSLWRPWTQDCSEPPPVRVAPPMASRGE